MRAKNVTLMTLTYQLCRRAPDLAKRLIRRGVSAQLPPDFPVDSHFAPRYEPWDQRLGIAPGGDLFAALRDGRATIVTDRIDGFTERGSRRPVARRSTRM